MPDWKQHIRPRLATLNLSPARESDILEELSQHLDDRWREALAGGASPEEAIQVALADLGDPDLLAKYVAALRQANPAPSITPGAPKGHLFGDFWQDLRYAARTLRKRPGFTSAAVLTLALGIGSNAAIFTVINAVLLRPLPFPNSERLMALYTRYLPPTGYDFPYFNLSGPEFVDVRSQVNAFASIAAYDFRSRNVMSDDGTAERIPTMTVTPGFFEVLGVKPIRGRTFTEDEARPGQPCRVVIREEPPGTAANPIGSTIRLDDAPCEVIGVLPGAFAYVDDRVRVWAALPVNAQETTINRQSHGLSAIVRLREGVTAEQAEAQLQSLRSYWSEKFPDHYAQGHFAVQRPLQEDLVGDQRDALLLLGGAVLFVLLIVCVNLAGLLVSNAEARRREFTVRHALGANRQRLIRQLVAEAILLAGVAGVVGVVLAKTILQALLALYPERLVMSQAITIDSATVLYTSALVIAAGFVTGLVPALNATGMRLQETMRSDSRSTASSRRAVVSRSVLVVGQLALSVVLLAGASLLIRSYQDLQRIDMGIEPDRVLTFSVFVPPAHQRDPAAVRRTLAAIEERLAATPGVEIAGAISALPLEFAGSADDFVIEGRPKPLPGTPAWNARYVMATPRVFPAFGIPLKRGRLLAESDLPGQPFVAVINEAAARIYWPGEDPVGKTIHFYPEDTSPTVQIVGVVGDVRSMGPAEPAPPSIYAAYAQAPRAPYPGRFMNFIVRASGNPTALAGAARAAVAAVDRGLPLAEVRPMSDVVSASAGLRRFTTLVISTFAGIAVFLAALGLYGILAYAVEQRVREIGVRVALGASRREIVRLIVGNGLLLAVAGVAVGVPAALVLTRLMGGVLSGVSSTDPLTYIAVIATLVTSALLASYLPARRAAQVDPIIALRAD